MSEESSTDTPRGPQIATSQVSDPSQDLQAARVEAAARCVHPWDPGCVSWDDWRTDIATAALAAADAVDDRAALVAGVNRLRAWKAEALPVMDGLQELGDALGISLGQRITGAEAKVAVETLVAQRDEALAEVERIRAGNDRLTKAYVTSEVALSDMEEERDAAITEHTAFVAALLELADRADRTPVSNDPFRVGIDIADDLRALVTTDDRATIERVKGEAAARALEEAADEMDREGGWETPQWWLRERADIYRTTEPTEGGE